MKSLQNEQLLNVFRAHEFKTNEHNKLKKLSLDKFYFCTLKALNFLMQQGFQKFKNNYIIYYLLLFSYYCFRTCILMTWSQTLVIQI